MVRRASLLSVLVVVVGLSVAGCGASPLGDVLSDITKTGGGGPGPGGGSGGPTMSAGELDWAMQVLDLVNQERTRVGVAPLQWLDGAAEAAYLHSLDMDLRNFFSHTNPDDIGPAQRLTNQGVEWTAAGENIARGYPTPGSVMSAWMDSSGHRANILSPYYTHLGVGVHIGGDDGPWWTQDFVGQ